MLHYIIYLNYFDLKMDITKHTMANYVKKFLFLVLHSLIVFVISHNVKAQTNTTNEDAMHLAEDLWTSIDLIEIKKSILDSTKIPAGDLDLFMQFISVKYDMDEFEFFQKVAQGNISSANLPAYVQGLTHKYILAYSDFLKVKTQFSLRQNSTGNKTLAANGPCTNTDFADSTTNGWQEYLAKACATSPVPCTQVLQAPGFTSSRISIMSAGTFDPFIPTLSTVAPGKTYSVHLEDYLNGANASVITQTFMVTPTNNIFTYHYAVVLEDPGNNHSQAQRPYFKVRMQDDLGNEITCADYTVWAQAPYTNFIHYPAPNPYPGVNNGPAIMDLYYRDWTTVSIPLLGYVGRNVTIEFMASDCSLGGHRGYAYIDADCSYLTPVIPPLVCGTSENFIIKGPLNFAQYKWTGPGIVGSTTADSVVLNKAGNYSVLLTPVADNPCPVTVSFVVPERCFPPAITVPLCETVKGSGTVTNVNLATFNTKVTAFHTLSTVLSWHSALPATAANQIVIPSNVTIKTGSTYYAAIGYATPGGDTAQVSFTVNSLPNIQIPVVGPFCQNGPAYTIPATPSGGIFSGQYVSSTGVFTPSTVGTFPLKYKVTNASGCIDSLLFTVVVNSLPTVNAGPDQNLCSTSSTVNLNGTVKNDSIIKWSGGGGTFSTTSKAISIYTPTAAEMASGSVTLTLTVIGKMPCNPVSDQVVIRFTQSPTVNSGPDQKLCATTTTVQLTGTVKNDSIIKWSGGNGTFSSTSITGPIYTPTAAEIAADSVVLTVTAIAKSPCSNVSDKVVIHFTPAPTVNAGPDQKLCSTSTTVNLDGTVQNDSIIKWSGGTGTFSTISGASSVYTPTSTEIAVGSVTLTLTVIGKKPCGPVSDQVVIYFTPSPAVNAGPDQKLCSTSTTVNLNGTVQNDSIFKWSGGVGTFSSTSVTGPVYTPTAAEITADSVILTLSVIGKSPCIQVTDQVIIRFTPAPTVNAGPDQRVCSLSDTVHLGASVLNDSVIKWSGGSGTFSSISTASSLYVPSAAELATGSVTLIISVTGKSPCSPVSDQLNILITPAPKVNAGPDQYLCNTVATVQLKGVAQNDTILTWRGGAGTFSSATITNPVYIPTASEKISGTVLITVTATGNFHCGIISDTVILYFFPSPPVNVGPNQIVCKGTVLNFTSNTLPAYNFVWKDEQGTTLSTQSTLSVIVKTDSVIVLTVTDSLGCFSIDTVSITSVIAPVFNLAGPYCMSDSLILNAAISNIPTSNITPYWKRNGVLISNANTYTLNITNDGVYSIIYADGSCSASDSAVVFKNPILNPLTDIVACVGVNTSISVNQITGGIYNWTNNGVLIPVTGNSINVSVLPGVQSIAVIVKDPNNCQANESVHVSGIPIPVVSINDTSVCAGQSATINGTPLNFNSIKAYNPVYTWSKNHILVNNKASGLQINTPGLYTVSVSAGSCIGTDSMNFTLNPLPIAGLPEWVKFCPDTIPSVLLTAGPAQSYIWQPNGETTQSILVNNSGYYSVTLTNQFNCSATGKTEVREICPPRLFVGNAFSPNKDGINDLFTVYGVHIGKYRLLIFNRWGEIIYESTDVHISWDGYYKGELMPIGVYPWIISYEGDSPEYLGPYQLQGSVTVVK